MITYQVKRTRGGRHYVIAWDGERKIYVTRRAHTSAEPALVEARNYINGTPETETEPQPAPRISLCKKLILNRR